MALLPRPCLDRLETSEWLVPRTHPAQTEAWFQRFRKLRIALVRQDVFGDLYCADPRSSGPELVRQSVRRTGPAGLVVDLQADYWILREDPAPECAVWMEKIANDPDPQPEVYRARKHEIPAPGFSTTFGRLAVDADAVSWEDYDLVISLDISVPFRIIAKTRRPVWAYLPGDPGVPTARQSLRRPPGNYHLSLTHSFRRYPVRPGLGPRTVEFPYTFLRRETWKKVFPAISLGERSGTMVEHQTESLLQPEERAGLEALGPLRRPEGSIQEVADRLNRSRYYFRCGGGPIVGNGIVEAAAAGCVAFGHHREFVSRSLFCRSNLCSTRSGGVEKMRRLDSDSERLAKLQALQGTLVDYFCFYRPIREIWGLWSRIKRREA
jgi:hypothetical protein